jgi:RNA polymerase sigma factor (sigma-70 family)
MGAERLASLFRQIRRLETKRTDPFLLLQFIARRDEAAFAELVERHGAMVLDVCRRLLGHRQDAEDAFQATFLTLARAAPSIRRRESLAGWLHGVAHRICLTIRRSKARRARLVGPISNPSHGVAPGVTPSPPAEVAWREVQVVLEQEIARLPEKYRSVFVMCHLEGRSRAETARELELKEGTISSRLEQARRLLRGRLKRRGIHLSAALGALALTQEPLQAAMTLSVVSHAARAAATYARDAATLGTVASPEVGALVAAVAQGSMRMKLAAAVAVACLVVGLPVAAARLGSSLGDPRQDERPTAAEHKPAQPAERPASRVDALGDPLPEGVLARLGTVRFRAGDVMHGLEFGPDGKTIVGLSNGLRVFDTATGKLIHYLPNEEGRFLTWGTLSPDHKRIAASHFDSATGSGCIRVWEVATGKHLIDIGMEPRSGVTFSPDGRRLVGFNTNDGRRESKEKQDEIEIWDAATGGKINSWKAGHEAVSSAIFTKDGKTLITAGVDKAIRFWDPETGKELRKLEGNTPSIGYITLSPDEKRLAAVEQRDHGPNTSPRAPVRHLPWHGENRIRVWNLETGKVLSELIGEWRDQKPGARGFTGAAFLADGKQLVTSGADRFARLWDVDTGTELERFELNCSWGMALAPDGRTFAAQVVNGVHLFDLEARKDVRPEIAAVPTVWRALLSPDAKTIWTTGITRQVADIWDANTARREGRIAIAEGTTWPNMAWFVGITRDGKTLVARDGDGHKIWQRQLDQDTPPRLAANLPQDLRLGAIALSPDGKALALGDYAGAKLRLMNLATGQVVRELDGHEEGVRHAFFTPKGDKLIACCGNHSVLVWKTDDWTVARKIASLGESRVIPGQPVPVGGQQGGIWYVAALSEDGRLLAYGTPAKHIALFDLETGRSLLKVDVSEAPQSLAFSPDGRFLAWTAYRETGIHLLETWTGRERTNLSGHSATVYTLTFFPRARRLLSTSMDGTGLIWDLLGVTPGDPLTENDLEVMWKTLGVEKADDAFAAIKRLVAHPSATVPFLAQRLAPLPSPDKKRLARLIADLGSDNFQTREQASKEFDEVGEPAVAACREALNKQPSPENRKRLEAVVERHDRPLPVAAGDKLRILRAIEVLEHIGTTEARAVLSKLAAGAEGAMITREASASLDRLRDGGTR